MTQNASWLILCVCLSSVHHHIIMILVIEFLKYKRKYSLIFIDRAFVQTDHYFIENGVGTVVDIGNQMSLTRVATTNRTELSRLEIGSSITRILF